MLDQDPARRRSPISAGRFSRFLTMQGPLIGGFVLLVAIGLGFIVLLISNHRFNQSVAHTLQVRNDAYRLLTLVQDAETGERGYLLTGNPVYLKPYEMGRIETPKALTDLQHLLARNEIQMATLARLRASVEAKLDDLRLTVGLKSQGQGDVALKHVNTNVGNDIMQQVRVAVGQIESEEERTQRAQSLAADTNKLLAVASIVGLLIVIVLASVSILTARRATAALVAAQDELRHANENLEGIVAERVAELQAANEEIQRFAYIVSHDLRAPLVNVMGFTSELDAARGEIAGFLQEVEAKAPEIVTPDLRLAIGTDLPEALGFIRTSTAKMDRLINAILKLSREGRRVLTPQTIGLRELIEAQGESLSQQMQASEAELKVQADLPDVVSDRLAVEQIFGNLIENAIKYLQPGRPGRIEVTGRVQGAYHYYSIIDNGRGIDKKDFERVFELFRRSGEQDKPGEGIGLAYVRNLVRRLGGNVTVKSELGTGSTFTVTLPAVLITKSEIEMSAAPVDIIMIEDDPGHARLIEKNVRRAGVNNNILHFDNGTAALRHLFQDAVKLNGPLLVLLDLNLPDMSGTDILEKLKADDRLKHAPVVVLTTTDDQREIQRCYSLGCNVYITKPVEYETFAQAIRQLGLFLSIMQVPEPT